MIDFRTRLMAVFSMALLPVLANADTIWNGMTSSSWSTSTNWSNGVPSSSIDADFIDSGLTSIDLGGNQSAKGINFMGQTLMFTLGGSAYTLSIGSDGISVSGNPLGISLTQTISSSVAFTSSSPTINCASNSTLVLSGIAITGTGMNESGSGTLLITGSAAFSSGATITGGTMQIGNNGTSGSFSGNITDNSVVSFDRSDSYTYSGNVSGSGLLMQQGSGALILTGSTTHSGGTTVSSGTLQIGNGGAAGSISGNVADNAVLLFDRSDSLTYSGIISGAGAVSQIGAGNLILTGSSSYSGGTTVSSGTLQIGSGGTSGAISGDVVDNGALVFNRSDSTTFSGIISGTGKLFQSGSGKLVLTGSNTYSGATTISSGTVQIGNGGTSGQISGAITDNGTLVFNRSDSLTYSSVISGTGAVVQAGSGTVIFTGNGTYSGGTTISSGTLQLGIGGASGQVTGDITNNGVLYWNRSNSHTYSGVLSGTGAMLKSGIGTLILTGSNTFTGTTTVTNGAVQIGSGGTTGSIAGNLVANNSGVIIFNRSDNYTYSGNISGNSAGYVEVSGSGNTTFTNLASAGSLYFIVDGSGTMTYSSLTSGTISVMDIGSEFNTGKPGTLVVDGAGTSLNMAGNVGFGGVGGAVNVTNGATLINGSDMQVGASNATADSTINVSGSNSTVITQGALQLVVGSSGYGLLNVSSNGTFTASGLSGSGTVTLNGGTFGMTSTSSASNPFVLSSGGGTINVSSGATFTLSGTVGGAGALTKSGSGTLTLTGTDGYSGNTSVTGGILKIGTGGRLGNSGSYSGAISIASGATLSYANGSSAQTLTGAISGSGTLAQDSTNDLILNTGTNSVANLTISGGRVFFNGAGSLGTISNITLTGGILDFGNSSLASAPTITMSFGSGSGIANRSLSSGLTLNTACQSLPTSGTMSFNNDDQATSAITVTGNYPALTGSLEIQVGGSRVGSNAVGSVTLSGTISGSGSLIKSYTGALILTGSNTYTGTTTISSGTLQLGAGTSTGSVAGDVVDNGTLVFNRSGSTYDFNGNISGTGSVIQNSSVTVRLGGSNTFSGGITVNAGTFTIGTGGSTGSITSNVSVGSTLIFNRTTDYSYAGNISGLGSIYKVNSSTLTLTGSNSYTGTTHLEGGLLNFTSLSNLGTGGGSLTFSGGGLQWATGSTTDISTRTVFIDTGGATLNTNGNNVTLANSIGNGGTGALTKSGSGTLTLSGTTNYSGATSVSAGTLVVSGSLSGTASVSVSSGADLQVDGGVNPSALISVSGTLNGTGRVGAVALSTTGTLVAGDGGSAGLLTLSGTASGSTALSGTTGSGLLVELSKQTTGTPSAGTDYSQIKVTQGTISLSKITLSLAGSNTNVKNGDLFFIILNGSNSSTGTFNGLSDQSVFTFNGQMYEISYFANHSTSTFATGGSFNDVALLAVPEPSPWVLVAGGGVLVFLRGRVGRKGTKGT